MELSLWQAPFFFGAISSQTQPLLTISLAVGVGIILSALAQRLNFPSIVLLLFGGFILGPECLNWVQPDSLGDILPLIVSFAIGIILFEGGLTLNLGDYAHATKMIQRLLSVGALTTWMGGAVTIWLIFDVPFAFAMLASSLVIVTGPTVIVPILKKIKPVPRVANILHWEGVLIDAIGVFIAVLCFEWVVVGEGGQAVGNFMLRVFAGALMGMGGGWLIERVITLRWAPESMTNVFVLASGILLFGLCETVISESGLLAVTLAGLYIGRKGPLELREIRSFKAEITDLMIAMLFILLVARLEIEQFLAFGWHGLAAVLVMMLVVRPLSVWISSLGIDIPWREKVFLAWVAPRGIVAASLASLFALYLQKSGSTLGDPTFLETFTYSIICATVIIQGLSASVIGTWLGVRRPAPTGWLVIGANTFGRQLAHQLQKITKKDVVLIDSNLRNINRAKDEGLTALQEDALDAESLLEQDAFQSVGQVLAITDNVELNQLIQRQWRRHVGRYQVYGWKPLVTSNPNQVAQPQRGAAPTSPNQERTGAVFGNIARPSVVSAELEDEESALDCIPIAIGEDSTVAIPEGHPLMVIRNERAIPLAGDDLADGEVRSGDSLILLHRSRTYLRNALEHGAFFEPEVTTLEALNQTLVNQAVSIEPKLFADQMLDDLTAQQKSFPAFLGQGVAVPHVYSSHIQNRMCLFARPPQGIPVAGQEDQIRLIFFLISPSGDAEGHLGTLAEIARCCNHQNNLAALATADSLDDVLKVV
ncbi:MAG: cation:proton antiporter [Verrucomicrobiota bacterium]